MMSLGVKRRDAVRALLPLARQVLNNVERLGARAAWTGPLSRGDYGVIAAHFAALHRFPREYADAYEALNQLAARLLSRDPEDTISQLAKRHNKAKAANAAAGRHG
jgi:predicted short-subunit dehydrogenase-like oxidoreductase (DUF2520 family)